MLNSRFFMVAFLCTWIAAPCMGQSLPLGRLSASNVPIPTSDVIGMTLHYTDGETDAQLDISGLAANTSYDVYDLGTQPVTIGTTAFGSSVVHGGKRVNGAAFTGCPQYACAYLGAITIGPTAGQINQHVSYGQNRRWDVWNFYNQIDVRLEIGEPASGSNIWVNCNWTICPQFPAFSALNGHTANNGTVFTGLPTLVEVDFHENGFVDTVNGHAPTGLIAAIGWDTATVGNCGYWRLNTHDDTYAEESVGGDAFCVQRNVIGPHVVTMLIATANGLGSTFSGGIVPNAWSGQQTQPDIDSVMWIKYKG